MQQESLGLGALILLSVSGPITAGLLTGGLALIMNRRDSRARRQRDDAQALHDKTLEAERRLAEIRGPLYDALLKPWALMWAGIKTGRKDIDRAFKMVQSPEYLSTIFAFNATASDGLVRAHNDLMTTLFNLDDTSATDKEKIQAVLKTGDLLLAIRKDFGHDDTTLTAKDMLRARIKDIDSL